MKQPKISVFRKMTAGGSHAPQWVRVFSGYDTVEQAKAAVMRQAYSTHFSSYWRVVERVDLGALCYEGHVQAGRRTADWLLVEPDEYYVHRNAQGYPEAILARDFPAGPIPGWTLVEAYSIMDAQYVASLVLPVNHG